MPISRQARMTRTAISPRLAIRIFLNMRGQGRISTAENLRSDGSSGALESRSPHSRPNASEPPVRRVDAAHATCARVVDVGLFRDRTNQHLAGDATQFVQARREPLIGLFGHRDRGAE